MNFAFSFLNMSLFLTHVTSYIPFTECLKQSSLSILTIVMQPHQVGLDANLLPKISETRDASSLNNEWSLLFPLMILIFFKSHVSLPKLLTYIACLKVTN